MSNIKINGNTYREEDLTFNMGVEFVKALIADHSKKVPLDHTDGAVTEEKLSKSVQDKLTSALTIATDVSSTLGQVESVLQETKASAALTQEMADENKTNLANSKLVYKAYQVAAGGTFKIKPNMMCIALPYGNKTIGIMNKNDGEIVSGNVGATVCFSAEINTGEYANGANHRVMFVYQPQSVLTTMSSYHNLLDMGAYFKNNGEGNMYVFALMREVDAE